ncbi:MAG: hypothetical protein HYU28_10725 [Actinobacteria bacterium]|nr:hypothetical protein [Actinomycetota bacterium]
MSTTHISVSPARRVSDPGAPRLRADVSLVLALAALVAVTVALTTTGDWGRVAALGAALVVGELLVVELMDETTLPLSLMVLVPLVAEAGLAPTLLATAGATGAAAILARHASLRSWASTVGARTTTAAAAWAVFWGADRLLRGGGGLAASALPATAAAASLLALVLAERRLRRAGSFHGARGHGAFFAVAASGVLTAIGSAGVDGRGGMGLWALVVFAVPALSARWAFGRLHAIRRTYDQTIDVLSVVPEMGGRARPGHSRRVAELCVDTGRMLGLSAPALEDLERAALLHALGSVTFDDHDPPGTSRGPREVAGATVGVLADEERLSRPAGLVAGMAGEPVTLTDEELLAARVLRAAASFEEVAGGDPSRARLALATTIELGGSARPSGRPSAQDGTDRRVVAALARVVTRRALVSHRG